MSKISAGSFDLNKWLYGGYEKDIITTLYGGPGTGKTNLCLIVAVSQAKKGKKVIFMDTEGGFSTDRARQIFEKTNGDGNFKKTLENILILKPTSFEEQKDCFNQLLKYLKEEVSLIIVDGMTMLYRLELASAKEKNNSEFQKVNSELARQMRILAEIARKRNIPVIATNQIYHWEKNLKMVGGDIMQYWSKCLIELEHDKGKRVAFLKKHRSLKESSFYFQVWEGGIRKKGWL